MAKLDHLGQARVFRDRRTGELIVDTQSIQGQHYEEPDMGADDYDDDDESFEGSWEDVEDIAGDPELGRRKKRRKGGRGRRWGMTAVGGSQPYEGAGPATVRIRLQHDFKAQDLTFAGTVPGAKVTSIFFGDDAIWSTPEGIDVSAFATDSMLRGLLEGQRIAKGLDITVNGTVPGEGNYSVTITGKKPAK